ETTPTATNPPVEPHWSKVRYSRNRRKWKPSFTVVRCSNHTWKRCPDSAENTHGVSPVPEVDTSLGFDRAGLPWTARSSLRGRSGPERQRKAAACGAQRGFG